MRSFSDIRHMVMLGGGHAHVEVLRRFAMRPLRGLRITLVSSQSYAAYSGMLPGYVAGHYRLDEINIDLRRLARAAGARFIKATASGLELDGDRVLLERHSSIPFDILSINIGSTPDTACVPGVEAFAIPVKPVDQFLDRLDKALKTRGSFSITMVGGGAAGVEMVLAMSHRLCDADGCTFSLIEAGPEILPEMNPGARRKMTEALLGARVAIRVGRSVMRVKKDAIVLDGGEVVSADVVGWATGTAAPAWLGETNLALDRSGFVLVDEYLRSTSHERVFAAGDVAAFQGHVLAKSGVYAVRQGPILADNLRRALIGLALRPYRPQSRFLSLMSTGPRHAVASRGTFSIKGDWAWRWKDRIDRAFMDRYGSVPIPMRPDVAADRLPETAENEELIQCKGCGAKLGARALDQALQRLAKTNAAVKLGISDDAALLEPPTDKTLVQSVDFFPALISDPYLFGRIAAVHCLGDLHAMGAQPWTALALAQVPRANDAMQEEDLFQMLLGVVSILEREGASLIGGHSGEGEELGLGLSVNGLCDPGKVHRKSGLSSDQVLILSKPLGTGALFAAEMRGEAESDWIDVAVASMTRSLGPVADILMEHETTAVTDVTGFGLAGHLGELLKASGVDAALNLAALPVLKGACEVIARGFESSAAPGNQMRARTLLADPDDWSNSELALICDPQTSGGLLAGVPPDKAEACIAALWKVGETSAIIGQVEPRTGVMPMIRRIG